VANVPPNSFFPRPDIHSAVVKIDIAPHSHINHQIFAAITKAAFASRRKTLQNCLFNSDLGLTKDAAAALLSSAGLPESIRGEALSLADFARLAEIYAAKTDQQNLY